MKTTCGVKTCQTHRIDKYAIEIVALKERLMRDGYVATAHAMEGACKAIGWEVAEKLAAPEAFRLRRDLQRRKSGKQRAQHVGDKDD